MKRLFALLMALCMFLSVTIFTVSAEEVDVFATVGEESARAVAYTLQYSTKYDWDASTMPKYNCYAYVLGKTDKFYDPGDFSGGSYNDEENVGELAALIEADLKEGLNKDCVKILTTLPSSTSGWSVIAARKDTTHDSITGDNDFHVAMKDGSSWYHKPGGTAILKFNSAPSNSVAWTNEWYDSQGYHDGFVEYESELRFILYKSEHGSTTYKYTGQNYHSGTRHYYQYGDLCADCGKYTYTEWISSACSGPPCSNVMGITPTPEVS
ncbi:MAG: hypothetical protein IJW41_04325 [Oscillospiraceae bacterium]|nr:hypothetical protein [Oscillospiraceae bacterium]